MGLVKLLPLARDYVRLLCDDLFFHAVFNLELLSKVDHFLGFLVYDYMQVRDLLIAIIVVVWRSRGLGSERILLLGIPMIPIILFKLSAGVNANSIHVSLWAFWRQAVLKEHFRLIDLSLLVLRSTVAILPSNLASNLHLFPIALVRFLP